MEQFYSEVRKEYARLSEIYSKARDNVYKQQALPELLEEVDQALKDTTVLINKLQTKPNNIESEEFKKYSSKIRDLRNRTNVLFGRLIYVKEDIDNALKSHQVMLQLQKTVDNTEDKYEAYVRKMDGIIQQFKKETNDRLQATDDNLKQELEKKTEAIYNEKKNELEKELEETLNTRIKEFQDKVVQPMNDQIHSDLDTSISDATKTIKKEFSTTLGTEKTEILNKFEEDYKTKLEAFKTNELQNALETKIQSFENDSLKPLEQRTLTNVLTIFGVFASFITIVMVLVGTASSWLNTADVSSAIIAFVVPSGIGVMIVCALTAFVRVIAGDRTETDEFNIGKQLKKWAPWLIVSVASAILIVSSINHGYNVEKDRIAQEAAMEAAKEPSHRIFVYRLTDCLCEEEGATKADGTKEIKQYVEISYFKNKSDEYVTAKKDYDEYESFIHDGKLFYCVIHECFE